MIAADDPIGVAGMSLMNDDEERIVKAYHTAHPQFAFICDGLRRIAVDPGDLRARRMLLRGGFAIFLACNFLSTISLMNFLSTCFWMSGRIMGSAHSPSLSIRQLKS